MKDNILKIQPEHVIEQQVEQQREYKRIGQVVLKRGLSIFYCDMETGEVEKLAIVKKVSIGIDKKAVHQNKAQYNENYIYVQALNKKNAIKKFKKMIEMAKQIKDGNRGK